MGASASERATAQSPVVETDLGRWKGFVREQEELCATHGFLAAVLTIGLDREEDLQPTNKALSSLLRSTDRAGVLCRTEISVLLVPVDSIHHAQRLVHMIDSGLRAEGLTPHVGWAMRLDGHGLFHASARADAAMLSARGNRRPAAIDLADR